MNYPLSLCLSSLHIISDTPYLQVEPWALWHERQGHHGTDAGESAHHHKHPPAVELISWAHTETPAWGKHKTMLHVIDPAETKGLAAW